MKRIVREVQETSEGRIALWVAVILALASSLPFLFASYPMQGDYPSHLARYVIMHDLPENAVLQQFYDFQWVWTGNLGVDMAMIPLGAVLGVERAAWLVALVLPPITGLGIIAVEWTLRRRIGVGTLLAFAFIWSPAMMMGFSNYTLSVALALFAFALWVWLEGWRWRPLLFVPLGVLVWLCHSAGWGVLGILVFGYEWHRQKGPRAVLAPWPLTLPFVFMLASPLARSSIDYGGNPVTYKFAIWFKAMAERSVQLDVISVLGIVLCIAIAARARKIDGRLGWAALMLALLTLLIPRHFGGGDFADYRLVPIALMVACMAIAATPPRWVLVLASALFLVRLGLTTVAWHKESDQLAQALVALEQVPRGARVAGASSYFENQWGPETFAHAPSYATVYRDALVNTHFALEGVHMLRVKQGGPGFVDPSQRVPAAPGEPIDLSGFAPARQAEYLWYFGDNPVTKLPAGATILHQTKTSLLARLAKPRDGR